MREATLWEAPLSRNKDPASSHAAAQDIQSTCRAAQCEAVYRALSQHPGSTSAELAQYMKVSRFLPARRLPDLEVQGRVRRGGLRPCTVCRRRNKHGQEEGRLCVTWYVQK